MATLGIDVINVTDREAVAVLRGDVDVSNTSLVARLLLDVATDDRIDTMIVDASGVTSLDPIGVELLVDVATLIRNGGARLVVRRPSDEARRVIDLTAAGADLDVVG